MTSEDCPKETAADAAAFIREAYEAYQAQFLHITKRSPDRFNRRDWSGAYQDALERLDLYTRVVKRTVNALRHRLGDRLNTPAAGPEMKAAYTGLIRRRDDVELAETFFNSVVRKIYAVVGVAPRLEFIASEFKIPRIEDRTCPVCDVYRPDAGSDGLVRMFRDILGFYGAELQFQDPDADARRIAERTASTLRDVAGGARPDMVEMITSVFYRDKAAYIIGRMRIGNRIQPIAVAFLSRPEGAAADAVLMDESDVSILFSFTRSYFHVVVDRPMELVNFLKTLTPLKRVSELYTAIGFHKHGKSELYRELTRNLETAADRFDIARGEKGMVMLVFTLPSFDVVFKIIKDRFDYPKTTNPRDVRNRYKLVFRHDRAGRLVDAQEFQELTFDTARFSPALLKAFRENAAETVTIEGDRLRIRHLYTERRLTPLDIFIEEAPESESREAVLDYGRSIKELAATNIFPGDLFLKNFGVTSHGRVVFYDYDELCLLTDCNFRKLPPARGYDDEMSSEPWFFVDDKDIFPEEFRTFLRFPDHLKAVFENAHADLFDADFWHGVQERLNTGAVIHIFPYRESLRFRDAPHPRQPDLSKSPLDKPFKIGFKETCQPQPKEKIS
ncbi:MAG: bifunctional isocitrate dehydrogenase kinase/phosphatase [Desulfococcus multivorans]|jgi:isocitrate dehydrogenase kinase/phosphatase|nr:bifunctional isocitrate dehydrogenase kinase/phosphatase [Desulfococcus multivorans]